MDTRTEPIRQDIDQIRDSMTDKMEQIEAKIKGTVEDTTETLKRGLDVKYQVSEHPWAALGAAVLAGYAIGSMGGSSSSSSSPSTYRYRSDYQHNDFRGGDTTRYYGEKQQDSNWHATRDTGDTSSGSKSNYAQNDYTPSSNQWSQNKQQSSQSGFFDQVMGELGIEMDTLKTAAISTLVNLVRDTVKQNLPGVYQEAERLRSGSQSSGSSYQQGGSSSSGSSVSDTSYSPRSYSSDVSSGSTSYGTSTSTGSSPYSSSVTSGSAFGSPGSSNAGPSTGGSGEGEFYREADITEGQSPDYDRTNEIYPAGSSESDRDPSTSTQRDVGRNPNYDMIPPSPHANPDGRP